MSSFRVPSVYEHGRWQPAASIEAVAACWRSVLDARCASESTPCAAALPLSADGVALFVALSARPGPMAVFSSDPTRWPPSSPLFHGMPLALPPDLANLADVAVAHGFVPIVLPPPTPVSDRCVPLRTAGVVVHTSGSTGAPKPVFRSMSHLIAGAGARMAALGVQPGEGLLGGVPFWSGQGVMHLTAALTLGGPLGIVGTVDHRETLTALALPEFALWRATAHFADVLGRVPLGRTPRAPRLCVISTPVSPDVFRRFQDRFGVPLRGSYSSTETGAVAIDGAPPADVVPGTVGRPIQGIEVSLGDRLDAPVPPGETGRIWVRSPWQMRGYGVPPMLERPGDVRGWWPTRDLGQFDADGRLRLRGRLDDCVRTRDGRLVNLDAVAAMLREIDVVRDVVVLPLNGAAGPSFGAVLQCVSEPSAARLRERIAAVAPEWARPRRVEVVADLPRLANGKPDRVTCLALLAGAAVA